MRYRGRGSPSSSGTATSSVASRCSGVSSPANPPRQIPSKGSDAMNRVLAARKSGSRPPWTIPNSAWSGREWASSDRSAQRCVRSVASATTARGDDGVTGWSNATATSDPSASWTAIACSGVKRWSDPSRWLRNVAPSSSMTRRSPSETTWNPPESVRIGRSQAMNLCSPPSRAIRSWPGRRYRWYVFARMIEAPTVRRSSGSSAFTVAFVPTGMNWGVSTTPWVSVRRPARAHVEPSAGGGVTTSNCAAPVISAPVQQRDHGRHDDRHEQHRPERDEDRDVLALDDDVAREMAEDRDARAGDDHEPDDDEDDAEHDERPPEAVHACGHPVDASPSGMGSDSGSGARAGSRVAAPSQSPGMSGSPRRGGGIS